MKKLIYLFLSLALLAACSKGDNNNVRVVGTVAGGLNDGDSIYLMQRNEQNRVDIISRTVIKDSLFILSGNVKQPSICNVVTFTPQGRLSRKMDFVADGGDIELKVLPEYYRVAGTPLNDALQQARDSLEMMLILYKRYHNKKAVSPHLSELGKKEADDVMAVTSYQYRKILYGVIEKNIDNILAPYFIKNNIDVIEPLQGARFIEQLPAEYNDGVLQYMHGLYAAQNRCSVDSPYVDFTMRDIAGNQRSLADVAGKGKPVLIALWMSNNKKSIEDMVAVSELQKRLGKRAEFVGVSLDGDYRMWQGTVVKNSLPGMQLNDLQGWNSAFTSLYGIDKAPYFLVIDGKGIIRYRGTSFADAAPLVENMVK